MNKLYFGVITALMASVLLNAYQLSIHRNTIQHVLNLKSVIQDYENDISPSNKHELGLLGYHIIKLACNQGDQTACIAFCNMDAEFISIDDVIAHEPNCKGIL